MHKRFRNKRTLYCKSRKKHSHILRYLLVMKLLFALSCYGLRNKIKQKIIDTLITTKKLLNICVRVSLPENTFKFYSNRGLISEEKLRLF